MRTITETKTVYKFNKLPENIQRELIENEQQYAGENFDSYFVVEDAAEIAKLFGLDIYQTLKTRMDKSTYYTSTVYYSGFWSQGDGACYEGSYEYKKGALKAIKQLAPNDKDLHRIVKELQELQKVNFYRITAKIYQRGHYYHSGCMQVELENSFDRYRDIKNEDEFIQVFRDFADWIYKQLENEYDFQTDEKNIREYLENNDCEYTIDGSIA